MRRGKMGLIGVTTESGGLMWRQAFSVLVVSMAVVGASAAPASGAVVDHDKWVIKETFEPRVVDDLPCLLGKQFVASGSALFRGNIVDLGEDGFHFFQIEKFEGTLVPVDGQGPTYVESGSAGVTSLNGHMASGTFSFTKVNNDRFIAYEDGKVVSAETIRIHETYHLVGTDTDGDGDGDVIRVEFEKAQFSCP